MLDAFTHTGRWGSRLIGGDRVLISEWFRGDLTIARILQYGGHGIGALVTAGIMLAIADRRLLERWYGVDAVTEARAFVVRGNQRRRFRATVSLVTVVGAVLLSHDLIFGTMLSLVIGLLIGGLATVDDAKSAEVPATS